MKFGLAVIQMDLDEKNNMLTTSAWCRIVSVQICIIFNNSRPHELLHSLFQSPWKIDLLYLQKRKRKMIPLVVLKIQFVTEISSLRGKPVHNLTSASESNDKI